MADICIMFASLSFSCFFAKKFVGFFLANFAYVGGGSQKGQKFANELARLFCGQKKIFFIVLLQFFFADQFFLQKKLASPSFSFSSLSCRLHPSPLVIRPQMFCKKIYMSAKKIL